jgi:hypothetical protein
VSERWDGTWVIYPKAHTVADRYEEEMFPRAEGHAKETITTVDPRAWWHHNVLAVGEGKGGGVGYV